VGSIDRSFYDPNTENQDRMKYLYPTCLLFIFLSSLIPGHCLAEQASENSVRSITVRVRTVTGHQLRENLEDTSKVQIDSRLKDLSPKLYKLQYQRYTLLSEKTEKLDIAKPRVIQLCKGHSLTLRPLYVREDRVGMRLKWLTDKGAKILDTRMHFDSRESMLTGTASDENSGLILAVNVNPVE